MSSEIRISERLVGMHRSFCREGEGSGGICFHTLY